MSDQFDSNMTMKSPGHEPIRQFVIYAENKVGWLNDFTTLLLDDGIHILAISVLDTTDSAVIRVIPNYPKDLARLLKSQSISFSERVVLAVECHNEDSMQKITQALLGVEINIHYVYPFVRHPNGKPVLAIAMEDQDIAIDALKSYSLQVLSLDDFLR